MTTYLAVPDDVTVERDGLVWIMHGDHILGPYEPAGAPVGELHTREMFARKMLVGLRTVDRWIKIGRIPTVRIGSAVRIPAGVLAAMPDTDRART
jgi:excisionase family DNA binding protein